MFYFSDIIIENSFAVLDDPSKYVTFFRLNSEDTVKVIINNYLINNVQMHMIVDTNIFVSSLLLYIYAPTSNFTLQNA